MLNKVGIFTITFMTIGLLFVYATPASAQTDTIHLSTKGTIAENSNFHGTTLWTIINGDKATVIIQTPIGRGIAHLYMSPSIACDASFPMCIFSNVTSTENIEAFKIGDTARFSIDPDNKRESISMLSGFLAGYDVTVNLSKVWNKPASSMNASQTQIANPASVYCIQHGGQSVIKTDTNGSQYGICQFSNGSTCDEWKYFRGECTPTP